MSRTIIWHIAIAVAAWAAAPLSAAEENVPKEQRPAPKRTLAQLVDALKRGDVDDVMACYADSEVVVAIQSYGRKTKGAKELRKLYAESFEEVTFERVELAELTIERHGDVAWATCQFSADTLRKVEKDKWRLEVQTSYVLQQTAGGWKIVLEQSTPLENVPRVRRRE